MRTRRHHNNGKRSLPAKVSNAAMKKALRMPPDDQIQIAVMWLFHNDGIGAEEDACKSVAKWLEQEVAERALRSAARQRIAQANATEYAP